MKEDAGEHLLSIRRGVWGILSLILFMFGYEQLAIGNTEIGRAIAIFALIAGIFMIAYVIGATICRFLMMLKKVVNGEDSSYQTTKNANKPSVATGDRAEGEG